tara:strand:+ start:899 stop:2332 length:1434 start_codon:yes stop_codon:yes gene_type:complete
LKKIGKVQLKYKSFFFFSAFLILLNPIKSYSKSLCNLEDVNNHNKIIQNVINQIDKSNNDIKSFSFNLLAAKNYKNYVKSSSFPDFEISFNPQGPYITSGSTKYFSSSDSFYTTDSYYTDYTIFPNMTAALSKSFFDFQQKYLNKSAKEDVITADYNLRNKKNNTLQEFLKLYIQFQGNLSSYKNASLVVNDLEKLTSNAKELLEANITTIINYRTQYSSYLKSLAKLKKLENSIYSLREQIKSLTGYIIDKKDYLPLPSPYCIKELPKMDILESKTFARYEPLLILESQSKSNKLLSKSENASHLPSLSVGISSNYYIQQGNNNNSDVYGERNSLFSIYPYAYLGFDIDIGGKKRNSSERYKNLANANLESKINLQKQSLASLKTSKDSISKNLSIYEDYETIIVNSQKNINDVKEEINNGFMDYSNFIQNQTDLYDSIESSNQAVVDLYKSFFDIYRLVGFPVKISEFSINELKI